MNTYRRRLRTSATVLGGAAIALAIGGLAQPAVAHALWDIGKYDSCLRVADELLIRNKISVEEHTAEVKKCCAESGGEWSATQWCTAPATAPAPPSPGEVIEAPGTGTATQSSPVGADQPQQPAPATPTQSAPPRWTPGWGINGPR